MRLRRSVSDGPGISRRRCGKGFAYYTADGELLSDEKALGRVNSLVIPPAWKQVWISPHANGHIQAVGRDSAGRRQYIYHEAWQNDRAEEKFDRVLDLSRRLPALRARLDEDLDMRGATRQRVLALGLRLLDHGHFRSGGDEYADENDSYGVATLLPKHVLVRGESAVFDYPAKSGVRQYFEVTDAKAARTIKALLRINDGSHRLLQYRNGSGLTEVHSADLNDRFRELVGEEFSVKDLRTWHATVLAAVEFSEVAPAMERRQMARARSEVMKRVGAALGNTATVARDSYVDPRVVHSYRRGRTIASAVRRAGHKDSDTAAAILDKATYQLIQRAGK
ncbi:DNA topoisomerase [Mycobacteroides saopaulense]|uniref:DNA topoisomerase IB n=1 Tax=Mycobacteroides saopaulense TaxID=1578165 RepID=UPI00071F32B1|nr:DNA topoisomerase IB [Mycobacteroides saopaulense]ALR11799.1 DNA topoisomerase [Mycobacteroides saopaulense]